MSDNEAPALEITAADLGLRGDAPADPEPPSTEAQDEAPESEPAAASDAASDDGQPRSAEPEVASLPPPSSWAKDQHERWSKLDRATQDYIALRESQMSQGISQFQDTAKFGRQVRDIFAPHVAELRAAGIDEVGAVQTLLNAHLNLTRAAPDQRKQMFADLARQYGVDVGAVAAAGQPPIPPEFDVLKKEIDGIKGKLTASENAALEARKSQAVREVEAFAADPAHPYFNELAEDMEMEILRLRNEGKPVDLEKIYDKAMWANPVTRAKELERVKADGDKAKREKSQKEAAAALKAKSANIRGRDTSRAPQAPLGTMEDTMRATLADIRSRAN